MLSDKTEATSSENMASQCGGAYLSAFSIQLITNNRPPWADSKELEGT